MTPRQTGPGAPAHEAPVRPLALVNDRATIALWVVAGTVAAWAFIALFAGWVR